MDMRAHHADQRRSPQRSSAPAWLLLGTLLIAAAALAMGWVGFMASDDVAYHAGAREWLDRPPFGGVDHWTTRFPLILTLAGMIAVFGDGPLPLAVTAIFWFALFVASGTALVRRVGGATAGWIGATLFTTMPLAATSGSVANCDIPEVVFLIVGILLLGDPRQRRGFALCAGFCFGAAILCRETAVLALMGVGLIFAAGRPVTRSNLLMAAAGAALVLGLEMLFQLAVSGNPLHRYMLAFSHDSTIDRSLNLEGNLLLHPIVDPLLVLLINNEFGSLFWLSIAAFAAGAHRGLTSEGHRAFTITAAMALTAFLMVALLGSKLVLNPRYFTIVAVAAVLMTATWLARMPVRPRLVVLTTSLGLNFLLLSAQNGHPQWPAEALVIAARVHAGDAITADRAILHRAALPIRWQRLDNVQPAGAPASLRLVREGEAPVVRVLARYPSPPTPLGWALRKAGLDDLLPQSVRSRLVSPNPTMLLLPPEPRSR